MNAQTDEQNEAEHKARNKFAHPTRASEHELEKIEWLWKPYIPLASLSGIYAHEGTGKGVLVGMVAALATLGLLDGNLAGEPTTVEFFSFEDNYSAVVKPRLIAAGADEDMCLFHTREDALILPTDAKELGEAIRDRGSKLVIIDPLTDCLRDGLKENSNNDVRKALVPLLKAAELSGAAIVGNMHPNKGATDAVNKLMGSKAWRSVPRVVSVYGANPEDPENDAKRVLAVSKTNFGSKQSVNVSIGEVAVDGLDDLQPKASLAGASHFTHQDVIARTKANDDHGEQKRAEIMLGDLLEDGGGELESRAIYAATDKAGLSRKAVMRARQDLQIVGRKVWTIGEPGLCV